MVAKKVEMKVCYGDKKSAVLKAAAGTAGVKEVKIGDEEKLIVIGEMDIEKLVGEIKKCAKGETLGGYLKGKEISVQILSVGKPPEKKKCCCCGKPCDEKKCCCCGKPSDDKKCDCDGCCKEGCGCRKSCEGKCDCKSSCRKAACCKKVIVCPKPCAVNPCFSPCNYGGYYQSSPVICYEPCYDNYGGSNCSIM